MVVERDPNREYQPHWIERAIVMVGEILVGWAMLMLLVAVPAALILWIVEA